MPCCIAADTSIGAAIRIAPAAIPRKIKKKTSCRFIGVLRGNGSGTAANRAEGPGS